MGAVRAQRVASGPEPLAAGQTSPLTAEHVPFPHAVAYLEDIRAKLVHAAESGEWSARILPEEAALLLRVLDEL